MRHAGNAIMLDYYAQTDMEELIAAQELILDAIFSRAEGPVQRTWVNEWVKTGTEAMGKRGKWLKANGRAEWTRTIDLFRVKEAL